MIVLCVFLVITVFTSVYMLLFLYNANSELQKQSFLKDLEISELKDRLIQKES